MLLLQHSLLRLFPLLTFQFKLINIPFLAPKKSLSTKLCRETPQQPTPAACALEKLRRRPTAESHPQWGALLLLGQYPEALGAPRGALRGAPGFLQGPLRALKGSPGAREGAPGVLEGALRVPEEASGALKRFPGALKRTLRAPTGPQGPLLDPAGR